MPNPTDIIERSIRAVVAVLQASADIQSILGRSTDMVTAWSAEMPATLPIIAYRYVVATPTGGAGDTREIMFNFSAFAATESVANDLLGTVENLPWAVALAALNPALDGCMLNPVRRPIPWDSDADAYRADLEMTLYVTK
jgi:hypothetical protein